MDWLNDRLHWRKHKRSLLIALPYGLVPLISITLAYFQLPKAARAWRYFLDAFFRSADLHVPESDHGAFGMVSLWIYGVAVFVAKVAGVAIETFSMSSAMYKIWVLATIGSIIYVIVLYGSEDSRHTTVEQIQASKA